MIGNAFLSVVLDGVAFFVWPAFEVKANLESFSGCDPLWKMARAIGLWTEALNTIVNPKLLELLEDYDARPSRAKIDFTRQWYLKINEHGPKPFV